MNFLNRMIRFGDAINFAAWVIFCALMFPGAIYALPVKENEMNRAARISIVKSSFKKEMAGKQVPEGKMFFILETEWENIHPKQKVEKEKLEGKIDRTMGVSDLASKKKTEKEEYVDVDVAYQIKKIEDHAYLLADGMAFSLHPATEKIPGGIKLQSPLSLPKLSDVKKVNLAYLIPDGAENLAFIFFDYQYGHIQIPLKGDLTKARGTGSPSGKILGQTKTDMVEFVAHAFDFLPEYEGKVAPEGWHYAVVKLSGKSLSGKNVRDIVQLKPEENAWISADGGYLYFCSESSTAVKGFIRFTPEVYQFQEIAFLVPEESESVRLGIRAKNEVLHIDLTAQGPKSFPDAVATHQDGDVMEVMLFGMKKENGKIIVDLGIRSIYDRGGLDIQTRNQFLLLIGDKEVSFDPKATETLPHRPPKKFIVPPGESIRFELAYFIEGDPTLLRFRGFKSKGELKLSK